MRPFRDLVVWQHAHQLTLRIYKVSEAYPRSELFGLTSQTRRAASSVATNIVEGSARSVPEFKQFLRIALGSAAELEYHLLLGRDLGYIDTPTYVGLDAELASVKRMLVAFIQRLRPSDRDEESAVTRRSRSTLPTAKRQGPRANA